MNILVSQKTRQHRPIANFSGSELYHLRLRRREIPVRLRTGAFTLVELMVVLFLLAVVAAVVVPNAIDTEDFAVVSAARRLSADLQYAQSQAITEQTNITVRFDTSGDSYELLRNESEHLIHPINRTEYIVDFTSETGFKNVRIVSADFGGTSEVTFDDLGAPVNAGSVVLQAGPYVYRIDVAVATGAVTVTSIGS